MSEDNKNILSFFYKAYAVVSATEYAFEMDYVDHIEPIEKQAPENFYLEYVWVVLNAGMKEQAARKIFDRFCESVREGNINFDIIRHPSKRKAIEETFNHYTRHLQNLQALPGWNLILMKQKTRFFQDSSVVRPEK